MDDLRKWLAKRWVRMIEATDLAISWDLMQAHNRAISEEERKAAEDRVVEMLPRASQEMRENVACIAPDLVIRAFPKTALQP